MLCLEIYTFITYQFTLRKSGIYFFTTQPCITYILYFTKKSYTQVRCDCAGIFVLGPTTPKFYLPTTEGKAVYIRS
jgi:hypothetical protein